MAGAGAGLDERREPHHYVLWYNAVGELGAPPGTRERPRGKSHPDVPRDKGLATLPPQAGYRGPRKTDPRSVQGHAMERGADGVQRLHKPAGDAVPCGRVDGDDQKPVA